MNKSDFYIDRVQHPKNKHNYIRVMDKISMSVHIVVGPRKVWINGYVLKKIINYKKVIPIFKKLRTSNDIENNKLYELYQYVK